ncbi:hypothetical protein [Streptomyces nanshensis]|uniref:hypothetical protein n=1 Tax=Streptomyces nanshensis TaxID=518642 RepID=UPI00114CEB16|nr:hypothetical protein [Streptomyces nanshensis]
MGMVTLAGEFEDIGDHLLGVGTNLAEKTLLLGLLLIVVAQVIRRFSLKAGIGALLGMAVCLALYNSRDQLSDAFSTEINGAGRVVVRVEGPAAAPPVSAPAVSRSSQAGAYELPLVAADGAVSARSAGRGDVR